VRPVHLDHGLDQSLEEVEGVGAQPGVSAALDLAREPRVRGGDQKGGELGDAQVAVGVAVEAAEDEVDLGV